MLHWCYIKWIAWFLIWFVTLYRLHIFCLKRFWWMSDVNVLFRRTLLFSQYRKKISSQTKIGFNWNVLFQTWFCVKQFWLFRYRLSVSCDCHTSKVYIAWQRLQFHANSVTFSGSTVDVWICRWPYNTFFTFRNDVICSYCLCN